ncbi:MAG: hypothetical protein RML93_02100 [Anaerolineales bacterium]|nr:hypothetical protein [Anaerolineales bacterium]MDW8446066.1 hypothetical protein [Anaerolineales bacterium]
MRIIRASEISSFWYCQRAWWYRLQGISSENQPDLESGQLAHHLHAHRLRQAIWTIRAAYLLLFLATTILLWQLAR